MSKSTETITRDAMVRALRATRRRATERATGEEVLEDLAREIEDPHACVAVYIIANGDGGPCETCGEWVANLVPEADALVEAARERLRESIHAKRSTLHGHGI